MNDTDTATPYDPYATFYGSSFWPFLCGEWLVGVFVSIGNGLVIWLMLGSKKLRSLTANWLVLDLAIVDFLFGFDKVILLPAALIYADTYPAICVLEAGIHMSTGMIAMSIPPMMAAHRYYTITKGVLTDRNALIRFFFDTKMGIICLMSASWFYFLGIVLFLFSVDQLGKDRYGYCATTPFKAVPYFLAFIGGFLPFGIVASLITLIYVRKLTKFMNQQVREGSDDSDTIALLKLVKIAACQPFVFQTPILLLVFGEYWFKYVDNWISRPLALMFAVAEMTDPWLTISILGPFRKEFEQRVWRKIFKQTTISQTDTSLATNHIDYSRRWSNRSRY